MNKKYKLIKVYPGSPPLGYEIKPKFPNEANAYYWSGQYFEPSDYPEFWEKIPELKSWYGINIYTWETTCYSSSVCIPKDTHSTKWFEFEAERDVYIVENKPIYSKKDIDLVIDKNFGVVFGLKEHLKVMFGKDLYSKK